MTPLTAADWWRNEVEPLWGAGFERWSRHTADPLEVWRRAVHVCNWSSSFAFTAASLCRSVSQRLIHRRSSNPRPRRCRYPAPEGLLRRWPLVATLVVAFLHQLPHGRRVVMMCDHFSLHPLSPAFYDASTATPASRGGWEKFKLDLDILRHLIVSPIHVDPFDVCTQLSSQQVREKKLFDRRECDWLQGGCFYTKPFLSSECRNTCFSFHVSSRCVCLKSTHIRWPSNMPQTMRCSRSFLSYFLVPDATFHCFISILQQNRLKKRPVDCVLLIGPLTLMPIRPYLDPSSRWKRRDPPKNSKTLHRDTLTDKNPISCRNR